MLISSPLQLKGDAPNLNTVAAAIFQYLDTLGVEERQEQGRHIIEGLLSYFFPENTTQPYSSVDCEWFLNFANKHQSWAKYMQYSSKPSYLDDEITGDGQHTSYIAMHVFKSYLFRILRPSENNGKSKDGSPLGLYKPLVSLCVHACVCLHVCVCVHMCTLEHVCVCTCVCACVCVCVHVSLKQCVFLKGQRAGWRGFGEHDFPGNAWTLHPTLLQADFTICTSGKCMSTSLVLYELINYFDLQENVLMQQPLAHLYFVCLLEDLLNRMYSQSGSLSYLLLAADRIKEVCNIMFGVALIIPHRPHCILP